MLIDGELRSSRDMLIALEEQLQIALENDREEMQIKLTENWQLQIEKGIMVDKLVAESNNLLETRAITAPIQSIKPVGLGKKIILIIAFLVGIFFALFTVFLAEFLSKAKKQQALL